MWKHTGRQRPDFAVTPDPGQESVWDYPRPPALVSSDEHVLVADDRGPIADSHRSLRILETASPPTYYIPAADINWDRLVEIPDVSFCEWKGRASYFALADEPEGPAVGWIYANPSADGSRAASWDRSRATWVRGIGSPGAIGISFRCGRIAAYCVE